MATVTVRAGTIPRLGVKWITVVLASLDPEKRIGFGLLTEKIGPNARLAGQSLRDTMSTDIAWIDSTERPF